MRFSPPRLLAGNARSRGESFRAERTVVKRNTASLCRYRRLFFLYQTLSADAAVRPLSVTVTSAPTRKEEGRRGALGIGDSLSTLRVSFRTTRW